MENLKRIRVYLSPSVYYWLIGQSKADHKTPSITLEGILRDVMLNELYVPEEE